MKRPWKHRIWFYRPQWYWWGWKTLVPIRRGGDEFDWHTIVLGWSITGEVVIATHKCRYTGACAEFDTEFPELRNTNEWPVDYYGHNHLSCGTCDMCLDGVFDKEDKRLIPPTEKQINRQAKKPGFWAGLWG